MPIQAINVSKAIRYRCYLKISVGKEQVQLNGTVEIDIFQNIHFRCINKTGNSSNRIHLKIT